MALNTKGVYYRANTDSVSTVEAQALATADSVPVGPNYIINGAMDIWQRGTSGTVGGVVGFAADRWQSVTYAGGTMYWFQVSAGANPAGARYALRIQRAAGATNTATMNIAYSLETQDVIRLAGKTVTWSFYARKGSTYSPASSYLSYRATWGTNTDTSIFTGGISGGANIVDTNVVLTESWQRVSQTFTIPANATSLGITWFSGVVGTAGASDYYDIVGIQLEEGSAATPFKRNASSLQAELAACQRYYWRYTETINYRFLSSALSWGGNEAVIAIKLPVTMRANPSTSISNLSGVYWLGNGTNYTSASNFNQYNTVETWGMYCTLTVPQNTALMFRMPINSYIEANAEL